MTELHHLHSKLKALKLGGMLDSLEHRLAAAENERLETQPETLWMGTKSRENESKNEVMTSFRPRF